MTAALEARARWHLELGYPDQGPFDGDVIDERDGEYRDSVTCWRCGGEGIEVFCVDDLCHGAGFCIHGDGDGPCRECHGDGVL